MITVSKSELKAHMLDYFRRVESSGDDLIVTSHRKPVLRVSRLSSQGTVTDVFGDVQGKARLPEEAVLCPETAEWPETT